MARWKTNCGEPQIEARFSIQDLWRELDGLASRHTTRWTWVVGHGDHDLQNRCDALAQAAARGRLSFIHKAERSMPLGAKRVDR